VGNCIIEFNGDRWHANPEKYGPEDRPRPYKEHNLTAKEIWDKDEERMQKLREDGYDILVVWESHVKLNKEDELRVCLNFIIEKYK
jgi:G:T-mismatch repair DNA endonuclease (very short patch repair protein)